MLPIVLMMLWGIVGLQRSFEDFYKLQDALELSALEVSNTLDMIIVLTDDLQEHAAMARDSISLFAGEGLNPEQLALMDQTVFKEALLQTYFITIFQRHCKQENIQAKARLSTEENGFIVEAQLMRNLGAFIGFQTKDNSIRLRILCEGIGAYMVANNHKALTVYLTPNGLEESSCFHTHYCWSLRRAKTVIPIALDEAPQGFPEVWHWQGRTYRLCGFCRQERWTSVMKD